MFAQRAFLLNRLGEKRNLLENLVEQAPSDQQIYKGWTIKEFLAHLSGWDDAMIEALQAHARRDWHQCV